MKRRIFGIYQGLCTWTCGGVNVMARMSHKCEPYPRCKPNSQVRLSARD